MKHLRLFILALVLILPSTAFAQDQGLTLSLSRDWGYGGFNGEIEGTFSMRVSGPENLQEVRFYIDDTLVHTATEAPFRYQFKTGSFESGIRALYVEGTLADGSILTSNTLQRTFLSADEANSKTQGLIIPILVAVGVISVLAGVVPMIVNRGKSFEVGQYGMAGGAVCSRCELPFSRSMFAPNMVVGKLQKCPHCGKVAIVPRASGSALEAAEARYRNRDEGGANSNGTPEKDLRQMLDDSRFDN